MLVRQRWVVSGIVVVLFLAGTAGWLSLGRPPVTWVVRHGLPSAGGPTGRSVEVEGVRFVEIGAGYYRRGSEHGWARGDLLGRWSAKVGLPWGTAPGRPTDEMPVRWVEIGSAYWLAATEVTNGQYERYDPQHARFWPGDEDPVTDVDWTEARAYCDWLSTRGSLSVRLPSEAEWEHACRAGSEREYCFGDDEAGLSEYGWSGANSDDRAHAAGTRRANAWGLFDLHGNVWEWCEDWYGPYAEAPCDGTARTTPGASPIRVFRGGGWGISAVYCRSAFRNWWHPSFRIDALGFRPAASGP